MVEAVRENNDLFHLPRSCKARIRSGNKEVRLPCPGRRYLKFRRITLSVIFSLLSVLAGLGPIFPSIIQAASHASADSATASPSLTRQGFNTATPDGPGVSLQPGTVKSGSRARPSFTHSLRLLTSLKIWDTSYERQHVLRKLLSEPATRGHECDNAGRQRACRELFINGRE